VKYNAEEIGSFIPTYLLQILLSVSFFGIPHIDGSGAVSQSVRCTWPEWVNTGGAESTPVWQI